MTNSGDGTVSVVDTRTDAVLATVDVGESPHWLTMSADGMEAYISHRKENGLVSVIDTETNSVSTTIDVGRYPSDIQVMPDNSHVLVVNSNYSGDLLWTQNHEIPIVADGHWSISAIDVSAKTVTAIEPTEFLHPGEIENLYYDPLGFPIWMNYVRLSLAIPNQTSRLAGQAMSQGIPLVDALVTANRDGIEQSAVRTNSIGDFVLFDLLPGTYDIEVQRAGYESQQVRGQVAGIGRTTVLSFDLERLTAVREDEIVRLPAVHTLGRNRPNPFNSATVVPFTVSMSVHVTLTVFDVLGQKVVELVNGELDPGAYSAHWDARDATGALLASGVYAYRLVVDGELVAMRKLLLLQ